MQSHTNIVVEEKEAFLQSANKMSVDPVENTDICKCISFLDNIYKYSNIFFNSFFFLVQTFHADEDVGNAKDIFKQKLGHALGCMRIKPSLFHSLVVSKKYYSIEGVLKKYLCSVIQG